MHVVFQQHIDLVIFQHSADVEGEVFDVVAAHVEFQTLQTRSSRFVVEVVDLVQVDLGDVFVFGLDALTKLLFAGDERLSFLVRTNSNGFAANCQRLLTHRQQVVNNWIVKVEVVEPDEEMLVFLDSV